MGLDLTVLGCAGTYAGPGNACSGYLLRSATTRIVLDLGPGTLANVQRHLELADIDAVVLTHEHPDHWLDLPVARNVYRYVLEQHALPVYLTAGTRRLADPFCDQRTFAWNIVADGDEVVIGDVTLRFSRTDHPVETLAVWAESGGSSLVYSADTGPGWSPVAFGARPDLALLEATFTSEQEGDGQVHLSAAQAGERAAAVGAGRLVITHLLPGADVEGQRAAAAATYGGPVEVAEVGATFAVGGDPQ